MKRPLIIQLPIYALVALVTLAHSSLLGAEQSDNKSLPNIKEDNSPLPPDLKARTSFSGIAKKISPSVVNVYSTRTVRDRQNPFFNDPLFRRFFGGPGRGESEGEGEGQGGGRSQNRQHTQQGLGSGVIVSDDGYIITNNHVVEDSTDIRVALQGGEEYPAKVVGTDPATDIAVLKVERTGLPAIVLGQTVTAGIVSGLGRGSIGIVDYEDFIQTDASINPGNSGGALTDVEGRLVGINTAILSRTGGNQGVGFAVPVGHRAQRHGTDHRAWSCHPGLPGHLHSTAHASLGQSL